MKKLLSLNCNPPRQTLSKACETSKIAQVQYCFFFKRQRNSIKNSMYLMYCAVRVTESELDTREYAISGGMR